MSRKEEQINSSNRKTRAKRWLIALVFILAAANAVQAGFLAIRNCPALISQQAAKYELLEYSRNFIPQEHSLGTIEPVRKEMKEMSPAMKPKATASAFISSF